jgi:hypothetical protein
MSLCKPCQQIFQNYIDIMNQTVTIPLEIKQGTEGSYENELTNILSDVIIFCWLFFRDVGICPG